MGTATKQGPWIQCLLTPRVWTEPGLVDTVAASAWGPSASPAPLYPGLLTALKRSGGGKGSFPEEDKVGCRCFEFGPLMEMQRGLGNPSTESESCSLT